MLVNPAASLEGMQLEDGWTVQRLLPREETQTGGFFSIGYQVRDEAGNLAFLKACDLSGALGKPNQLKRIRSAVDAFSFEKDLLAFCGERKLTKVVKILSSGQITVDDESPIGQVDYIVFEHADGDIRGYIQDLSIVDEALALAILHEVSIGLRQLHQSAIAHQDIKPSNVLAFNGRHPFRISDFGTASRRGYGGPRDALRFAGSRSIASPELLYDHLLDWSKRRLLSDLFALGNLAVFLYTGSYVNAEIEARLKNEFRSNVFRGSYADVLPHVQRAHAELFLGLDPVFTTDVGSELKVLIRNLTEPDPEYRGWPPYRRTNRQHVIEPFVSRFGTLRRKAEYSTRNKLRAG